MPKFVTLLAGTLLCLTGFAPTSAAETFPTKPIVLVSWSAAGSPVDVMAREIAKLAPKYLGTSMVVEDKVGADGGNALSYVLGQPADGYTLLALTNSLMVTLNTSLKEKFKTDQFTFLASLETDPYVVAVRTESPLKTFADLTKAAKQGNLSIGGPFAQSAESFFAREMGGTVGMKFNWVPFSGGSPAVAAALGGHIDAVCTNISGVSALVKSSQMRVLAVSTLQPAAVLPGTPTFASLGYKSLTGSHWRGVMARTGLPLATESRLANFLKAVAEDPEFKQYVVQAGLVPYYNDRNQLEKIVAEQMVSIGKDISAGIGAK